MVMRKNKQLPSSSSSSWVLHHVRTPPQIAEEEELPSNTNENSSKSWWLHHIAFARARPGTAFSQIGGYQLWIVRLMWSFVVYTLVSLAAGVLLHLCQSLRTDDYNMEGNDFRNATAMSFLVAALIACLAPIVPLIPEESSDDNVETFKSAMATFFNLSLIASSVIFAMSALATVPLYDEVATGVDGGEFPLAAQITICLVAGILITEAAIWPFSRESREREEENSNHKCTGICNVLLVLALMIAQGILAVTFMLGFELAFHRNVSDSLFDHEGDFDPHHWQYGALFWCAFVFASTPQRKATSCYHDAWAIIVLIVSIIMIMFKGLLFGVYMHGLWSYGPDPAMRDGHHGTPKGAWPLIVPLVASPLCAIAICFIVYKIGRHPRSGDVAISRYMAL